LAQFQRPNPYQPGYATPNYVYGEPPGRGTLTTKGLPRGTIDNAEAHTRLGGFATPGYVLAETPGRGVYATNMLPRRFVDALAPDDLARPFPDRRQGSLSGTVFSERTLTGSSLGDTSSYGRKETNPFKLYGIEAAQWIENRILKNPRLSPDEKKRRIRQVLDRIDPSLRHAIGKKAEAFRQQGDSPHVAFRKALAAALAEGLMNEVQGLGRKGRGLSGLGSTSRLFKSRLRGVGALGSTSSAPQKIKIDVGGAQFEVTRYADGTMEGTKTYKSPGGLQGLHLPSAVDAAFRAAFKKWSGVNILGFKPWEWVVDGKMPLIQFGSPKHGVYLKLSPQVRTQADADKITSAVLTIKKLPPPDKNWIEKGIDAWVGVTLLPFKIVGAVVGAGVDLVEDVVEKVGGLACKVVNSDLGVVAAGTAGAVYGGGPAGAQAGMMGAQLGQSLCGKTQPPPPVETSSFPILPLALAAGGVVLVYLAVK
jgi:hypothetical protein